MERRFDACDERVETEWARAHTLFGATHEQTKKLVDGVD